MEEQTVTSMTESTTEVMSPPKRVIPWGKILGYFVLGLVVIAGILYTTVLKPYMVVGKSIASVSKYDSAQVIYQTDDQKFKLVMDGAGEGKPFKMEAKLTDVDEKGNSLTGSGVFDEQNMYVQINYSDPKSVDEILMMVYPMITRTQTYKLAAPLWKGEKWLHIALPETTEDKPEVNFEWDTADQATKKFMTDMVLAIKPGKIEQNYGFEGESYTKVSYGFRKDRLIKAIEDLKDMKLDMKVSQINSLVEIVESSDDWDRDLLTFLIDKKGDLRVVLMQLPKIDEKVLQEGIAEGASEDKTGMAAGVAGALKSMVWKEEGELVSLGSIRLGQFDQVKAPEIPTNLVEGATLWETAVQELGPIIGQMMMASGQQPSGMSVPTYPTATPRVNPGMYAPGQLKKQ